MEIKDGYKNTDYGILPNEWKIHRIQDLINSKIIISHLDGNHGALYPKSNEFKADGIPYIAANDFINGIVYFNNCKFLTKERASLFQKGISKDGDVLFAHNATVGPVALLKTNLDYVILSTTATYFRCNKYNLSNLFLLYVLQSPFFVKQYSAVMSQSTRNQVPITAQRKFYLPLPPLPEQKAIAEVLSDTDNLIQALEKRIAKKRLIKQGAMQKLLAPKDEWKVKTIEEITVQNGLVRGPFGGALKKEYFVDKGIKVYEQKNAIYRSVELGSYYIDNKKFNELKRFELKEKDFIVSCSGTIGKIYQIPANFEKGIINQALLKITTDNNAINDRYFFYYFDWDKFQEKIIDNTQGGAMKNLIGMAEFKNTKFPIPSLPEQTHIATILSDMDSEIEALEKKRAKYQQLKQGLMQNLLTGKIRLV